MKPRDIKEMRARLGLTQRGLAETIGCTIYAICNYEQGQRHPADPFDMRIKKLMRKTGIRMVDEEDEE